MRPFFATKRRQSREAAVREEGRERKGTRRGGEAGKNFVAEALELALQGGMLCLRGVSFSSACPRCPLQVLHLSRAVSNGATLRFIASFGTDNTPGGHLVVQSFGVRIWAEAEGFSALPFTAVGAPRT